MTNAIDCIRILLVDDNPAGFPRARGYDAAVPEMDYDYRDCFEFRWVATPGEAREMRDLSWLIEQHDPQLLGHEGWVPEIMAIDYTLLQYEGAVEERVRDEQHLASISPLIALRQCASRLGITVDRPSEFALQPAAGTEYWGCFIGGLLMNTFAGHPCAPVTITRYTQDTLRSQGLDAAFFEWMMAVQSSGLLHAAGDREDVAQSWHYVIRAGVRNLRTRISALAKAGIAHVDLEDLKELSRTSSHSFVTVRSRYGRRRYPVRGLFMDETDDPQQWAKNLLEELIPNRLEFNAGEELAQLIWRGYGDKELQARRWRLADLLYRDRQSALQEDEALELEEQKTLSGYQRQEDSRGRVSEWLTNPKWIAELRMGDYTLGSRRWAALLLTWRLMHRMSLIAKRRGEHQWVGKIEPRHLYHLLFPLPEKPAVLPWCVPNRSPSDTWTDAMFQAQIGVSIDELRTLRIEPWERRVLECYGLRWDSTTAHSPASAGPTTTTAREVL